MFVFSRILHERNGRKFHYLCQSRLVTILREKFLGDDLFRSSSAENLEIPPAPFTKGEIITPPLWRGLGGFAFLLHYFAEVTIPPAYAICGIEPAESESLGFVVKIGLLKTYSIKERICFYLWSLKFFHGNSFQKKIFKRLPWGHGAGGVRAW